MAAAAARSKDFEITNDEEPFSELMNPGSPIYGLIKQYTLDHIMDPYII